MISKLKPKSEFSRNVLTLMAGTTIAQAIPIAASPILTRIYSPENFGILALFLSLVSILSMIATGRYELAIMLPSKEEDAIYIAILSILIAIIISVILFFIFSFFNKQITSMLGNDEISVWLYWVPVAILITSIYQSLNFLSIRKKNFNNVARSKVLQSSILSITSITIGVTFINKIGLITGQIAGQVFSSIYLAYVAHSNKYFILKKFNKLKLISLAKRYSEFPKIVTLTGVLNTASAQAPVIILTSLFGLKVVGFYSFAERMLALPIALLGTSIGQVFFQEMSTKKIMEDRSELLKNTFDKLLKIASPIFAFIFIFGGEIFSFVFGDEWVVAGEYSEILSLWLFLVFIVSPLTQVFNILEKQRLFLMLNFIGFILRVLSLLIGGLYFQDTMISLQLFVGAGVITWIMILSIILIFLSIKRMRIFLNIIVYFFGYIFLFYIIKQSMGDIL